MQASDLISQTPREAAGASTARAFDFQMHFSMSKILATYDAGDAFTAVFDHFDDLILVQGAAEDDVSFYQVKSKSGSGWTPKQLARRAATGDLPRSIIGKAYYNIHQFGSTIRRASIVSNQPLTATYETNDKTKPDDGEILFGSLCETDCDILVNALALDFPKGIDCAHQTLLSFERVPLDLASFRDTILGQVATLADKIDPTGGAAPKPIYDALLSEAVRCTGDVTKAQSLSDLKARKSLGRRDIDALVERVQQRVRTVLEWWDDVGGELTQEGVGALAQRNIRLRCLSYWRERQRGSLAAIALGSDLRSHMTANEGLIGDKITTSITAIRLAGGPPPPVGEPYDLESAYIVELMERAP